MKAGRWKVRCINWSHPDLPHAATYLWNDRVGMRAERYHPTWNDAIEWLRREGIV